MTNEARIEEILNALRADVASLPVGKGGKPNGNAVNKRCEVAAKAIKELGAETGFAAWMAVRDADYLRWVVRMEDENVNDPETPEHCRADCARRRDVAAAELARRG